MECIRSCTTFNAHVSLRSLNCVNYSCMLPRWSLQGKSEGWGITLRKNMIIMFTTCLCSRLSTVSKNFNNNCSLFVSTTDENFTQIWEIGESAVIIKNSHRHQQTLESSLQTLLHSTTVRLLWLCLYLCHICFPLSSLHFIVIVTSCALLL